MHVLVIDADKTLRSQVAQACKNRGYTVRTSAGAQDAITACEEQLPDVVLLELQLRGHSGVEFIHELRSYSEWGAIPIVLYTLVPQAALHKFASSFSQLGIVGYVYKPEGSFQKLFNKIEDAVLVKR